MLSARLARPAARNALLASRLPIVQRRTFLPRQWSDPKTIDKYYPDHPKPSPTLDPDMNGGYIGPPFHKRQHRDPYAKWWDPQERRNFGEDLHQDADLQTIMSTYEYTWSTTKEGLAMWGVFATAFASIVAACYMVYPENPAYPTEFDTGLVRELGGMGAMRARIAGDPDPKRA